MSSRAQAQAKSEVDMDISDFKPNDVGKWVTYKKGCPDEESGRIKSMNDKYVFVVYSCDSRWNSYADYTAQATDPKDISFALKA